MKHSVHREVQKGWDVLKLCEVPYKCQIGSAIQKYTDPFITKYILLKL